MRIQRRDFLKAALVSGCGFSLIAPARNEYCDISGLEKDLAGADPAGQLNQGNPRIEVPEGWSLYWSDEFDGSTIDTSKWKISNGGRWLSENAFISEGALQLRASMTSPSNNNRYGAEVRTGKQPEMGLFSITPPARIEIRFKPIMKPGSFIAIWLMQAVFNRAVYADYSKQVWKEFDFLECSGGENAFNNNSIQIMARMTVHSWQADFPWTGSKSSQQKNIKVMIDVGNPVKWQEGRIDWDNENLPGGTKELRYYWRESGAASWDKPYLTIRPDQFTDIAFTKKGLPPITREQILSAVWNEPMHIVLWNHVRQSGEWLAEERISGKSPSVTDFPVDVPIDYVRVFIPKGDPRLPTAGDSRDSRRNSMGRRRTI